MGACSSPSVQGQTPKLLAPPKLLLSSPQPKAQSASTHNLKALPKRYPSSFRKLSPIPASRKKASELKTEKEASPSAAAAAAAEDKKPQKKEKAKNPSKSAAQPQRPASSFFKRSPIPKDRVPTPISKNKNHETESASTPAVDPATDSPFSPELKEILDRGKESEKSTKTASAGTPAKKKAAKVVVREETQTVVEVAVTSSGADSGKKKTSSVAAESEETSVVDVAAAENGAVSQDLGSYKLPELRSLAKARGLKGYSKLKKGELVDLLAGLES